MLSFYPLSGRDVQGMGRRVNHHVEQIVEGLQYRHVHVPVHGYGMIRQLIGLGYMIPFINVRSDFFRRSIRCSETTIKEKEGGCNVMNTFLRKSPHRKKIRRGSSLILSLSVSLSTHRTT
jgi:hypothetical protein